MTKVAVLDDWQGVAKTSADWSPLQARAEVVFFAKAFDNEDDAARQLADFDIVLSMRERTPLPGSLINRLPKLRMLGMTGARNASLDTPACTARGIVVCNTAGGGNSEAPRRNWRWPADRRGARDPAGDANIRAGKFQEGVPVGYALQGKTHGRDRARPARLAHGALLQGAEHERAGLEPEPDAGDARRRRARRWCPRRNCCRAPTRSASTWCCRTARAA